MGQNVDSRRGRTERATNSELARARASRESAALGERGRQGGGAQLDEIKKLSLDPRLPLGQSKCDEAYPRRTDSFTL